jgi:hypothetical protein
MPLKIKIFTWQLARGRLPSNDHIHAWGGPSDGLCALCGPLEIVDHIFFECILAQFLWSGVRDMFRVNWNPKSRQDWFQILESLNTKSRCFVRIFFAAQCWALWTTRSKFTIEKKFPRHQLTAFSKLLFLCSCGALFKGLRASPAGRPIPPPVSEGVRADTKIGKWHPSGPTQIENTVRSCLRAPILASDL